MLSENDRVEVSAPRNNFKLAEEAPRTILIGGGIFLIAKATTEIHEGLEGEPARPAEGRAGPTAAPRSLGIQSALVQIVLLDAVFSLDSVITAVGMAKEIFIMIAAIVIAVLFMMFTSGAVSAFIDKHPTIKILALSFLLLIGVSLMADGLGTHVPKGYIYFAMGFSVFVEMINLRMAKKGKALKLHDAYKPVED